MQDPGVNGRFPSELWQNCLDIWSSGQVCLPEIKRWSRYTPVFDEIRLQDCLQHSYSISVLADMIMIMLEPYVKLDKHLLSTAFAIHDIGEGLLKRDVPYADKRDIHDYQEYMAFCERFGKLPERVFKHYQRAFLLQFCLKNPETFPEEARQVMAELAGEKRMEAMAFAAIEQWDYLMYGLEQYQKTGNGYVLHVCLDSVLKLFEKIKDKLPGIDKVIWKNHVRQWCMDFFENHDRCPCGGYRS